MELDLHIAALGHLEGVAQHAEARHIRAGVDAVLHHGVPCGLVQGGHQHLGKFDALLRGHVRLGSCGDDADADGLGEQQHIPRLGPGVGQHLVRVDEARHRQAVLRLLVQDAVAAGDEGSGLVDLVIASPQQLVDSILGHVRRDSHDVQAQLGFTAHGVHVAEGVGGRDLAEEIGVVGNRREEIHRLHQGQVLGDLVDAGVVALVKAHQQVGVLMDLDAVQQLGQDTGAHLGTTAGALGQFRQLYFIFRHGVSPFHTRQLRF